MDADDTRNRVLQAAGKIFAESGYELGTVREICEQAGANIAAVNYYFGDKKSLYLAACVEAQCVREGAVPMPEWPPGTPPAQRLRDFIHTFLRRLLEEERPAWHRQLMLREMATPTEACSQVVEDYIRPMALVLRGIVEELLPAGTSEVDAFLIGFSVVAQCLFYHINQPIASRLMGTDEYGRLTIDKLTEHITRFSLAALGYAAPLTRPAGQAEFVSHERAH
ncbi:MAG: CerR family C-terminal domain-containing protein [Planctomycetia bacterium]|nr:CerR family C-terminal domain-containing protein [Planctomycetia bacterium]